MKKALVLTVGTANPKVPDHVTGLVEALKGSVRSAMPNQVVLLASDLSMIVAERVQDELNLGAAVRTRKLADADHYERTFVDALAVFRGLLDVGFAAEQIDVDYTSGTKAMSVGVALAAVAFGCGNLRYIAGERPAGTVMAGTEDYRARCPARVRAYYKLQVAADLLRALQFEAARRLLRETSSGLLDEYSKRLHASLAVLVEAYDAWDKFEHGAFTEGYRPPDADLRELANLKVADAVRGQVGRMAAVRDAERHSDWRKRLTADHLADLWNNAERRRIEGKHDDAVARLYRLTEMLAQYVLWTKHRIDSSDVDLDALSPSVPDALRAKLAAKLTGSRKKVEVGLREAYELLAALGDPLGRGVPAFGEKQNRLAQLLDTRNGSILAHGLTPIQADDAAALATEVRQLAELVAPDFSRRCSKLQFPWLTVLGGRVLSSEPGG